MKRVTILLALGAIACNKSAPDQAGPAPTGSAEAPKPPPPSDDPVSDNEKALVIGAANVDKTELQLTPPAADAVSLAAVKRLDGTAWKVDVTIAGKVVETIDDHVTKDDPKLEPLASVVRFSNAAVLIAGSRTKAVPRTYAFDARLLKWSAAAKQVVVAKQLQFSYTDVPDPN